MSRLKRITRRPWVHGFLSWVAAQYIRFVFYTTRWRWEGDTYLARYVDVTRPVIVCFWHSRLLMLPYAWRMPRPIHILISAHPDGQLISNAVAYHGIRHLAGSSTRGGISALKAMVKTLEAGECVGLTPDGPRGPREQVTDGILHLARMAGADILPIAYSVRRKWFLPTWDRFLLPLPFNRGIFVWGEPLGPPPDKTPETLESWRHTLQQRLDILTQYADTEVA